MPQPPAYNRTKDFTEDFGSETDHSALNAELDKASNSINDIRTNLAILQADDGKLNPNVITTDSISEDVRNDLSQGILAAVGTSVADAAASAAAAALSETHLTDAVTQVNASKVAAAASEAAALASKNSASNDAASALTSKNTVVTAEANVATLASNVATAKIATDANAASALANKNASDANASNAALSATAADASKVTVLAAAAEVDADRNAAEAAALAAAASEAAINPANLVHRTGDESIAGIKTFAASPQVPDLADADSTTSAANTKFVQKAIAVSSRPTQAEMYARAEDAKRLTPKSLQDFIVAASPQNTTSETTINFTGIPSWARRITIMLAGVSTNGASLPIVQLGTTSGYETSNYFGSAFVNGAAYSTTVGAVFSENNAACVQNGIITIACLNKTSNTWAFSASLGRSDTGQGLAMGYAKALAGTLDRLRLTTANGIDTFDAGSVNIMWE